MGLHNYRVNRTLSPPTEKFLCHLRQMPHSALHSFQSFSAASKSMALSVGSSLSHPCLLW